MVDNDSLKGITPQAIFLDAAGTLFEVRGSVGSIYSKVASRHGVKTDPEELQRAFVDAFRTKSSAGFPRGADKQEQRERQWWFELVRMVLASAMPAETLNAYFHDVFEIFRTAEAWQLFPDTLEALKRLRSAGYRLGIISNFDSRLAGLLENLGIGSFFETVTISWSVGAAKPDARIFHSALEAAGVPAANAIHAGDSPADDAAGACTAGLIGVLVDRGNFHPDWTMSPRVESLSQLCELVSGTG